MWITTILIIILGIKTSTIYANELNKHDPQEIVIDEVAGQFLCLLLIMSKNRFTITEKLAYGATFCTFYVTS